MIKEIKNTDDNKQCLVRNYFTTKVVLDGRIKQARPECGGFGITNCRNINALYFIESEKEGLKLRKSNRDIVKIKQDN